MTVASDRVVGQLSLDVASDLDDLPIIGVVRIAGELAIARDLDKDAHVKILVVDPDSGEALSEAIGEVRSVKLTTKRSKTATWVERQHGIATQD